MAHFQSLHDLWIGELNELYDAENQFHDLLPELADAIDSPELAQVYREYMLQTEEHMNRLVQILKSYNENPRNKKCKAMMGIIEEIHDFLSEEEESSVRDAGLIASTQRALHYELSAYGTVQHFADILGQPNASNVLQQSLDEKFEVDKKLTELAESRVNLKAARLGA